MRIGGDIESSDDTCASPVPSAMAEVDPKTFTVTYTAPVAIDMASVAVDLGDECWIGAARGSSILRLPQARC